MTNGVNTQHDRHQRRIARALQRLVGRGKAFSVAKLARESGYSGAAVKHYVAGSRTIPAPSLLRFMVVLPASFAAEVMASAGYRAIPSDGIAHDDLALLRLCTGASHRIAAALRNGRVDHRQRADLNTVMTELAACAAAWAEHGRAN